MLGFLWKTYKIAGFEKMWGLMDFSWKWKNEWEFYIVVANMITSWCMEVLEIILEIIVKCFYTCSYELAHCWVRWIMRIVIWKGCYALLDLIKHVAFSELMLKGGKVGILVNFVLLLRCLKEKVLMKHC